MNHSHLQRIKGVRVICFHRSAKQFTLTPLIVIFELP